MTPTSTDKEREAKRDLHFADGDQMPYRWPRGQVSGSRIGLRLAEAVCVLLLAALVALVVYMARMRWG